MERYNGQAIVKFDGVDGNAASGVIVTVIDNSTGVAAILYEADDTSGATLTNPMPPTDSDGRYYFYAKNGSYTLSFDSGDPDLIITMFDGSSGAIIPFDTMDKAINSKVISDGDVIYIKERSAGNGGGGFWSVRLTSSLSINNFNTVTSIEQPELSIELIDKSNPEATGARADGVFDNAAFFGFAQDSGLTFEFDPSGTYLTTGTMTITNGTRLNGNGAKIILGSTNALGTVGSDSYIGDFDIDGEERDHTAALLTIDSPSENAEIGDMKFRNVRGTGAFQTYDIVIPMYGAENFRIGNTEHYNIKHVDNGVVAGQGFVGGLYLVGLDSQVANGKSYGKVGDTYGQGIKTVDGGSGVVQDSDLIRAFAETNTDEELDIIFGDVTGRDVGKRLVKAASCAGITMGDIFSYVTPIADGGLTMHATVEFLSSAIDWKVGRVGNEGPNTRVVWHQGATGCKTGDIYNGWGSIAAIFGGAGLTATECAVGDITGRNRGDGDQDGTAVYFYNADGCTAGKITGEFEYSVRCTNNENTGKNVVGDVNANAKMDLTYGETVVGNLEMKVIDIQSPGAPIVLGDKFKLTNSYIETDGIRTINIVGTIDGDLGNFKVIRSTNSGGLDTDLAILTTEGGSAAGKLKGNVYVEVQNAIPGTPVVNDKTALVYLNNLLLDLDKLHVNITTPTRGAVGYNCWVDSCSGYIGNLLVRSSYNATTFINGSITIDKAAWFTANGVLSLNANVALFQAEKLTSNTITGAINTPVVIDVTRP